MHDLVEKVKGILKEKFRNQLESAIHTKFQNHNLTVNENIKKLEDYLAKVTPELNLLRNQGNHLVLAKQVPKTLELRKKTKLLKEMVDKSWEKSLPLIQVTDVQIALKPQVFNILCRKMVEESVGMRVVGGEESKQQV